MEVTKANLATYLSALAPSATPYPIKITETITSDWVSSVTSGTVGSIIRASTPNGVYLDLGLTIIPNSVTSLSYTFRGCTPLITAPIIQSSVANMNSSFENCTSLTTAQVIPNSVTNMYYAFRGCTSLHTIQNFAVDVDNCNMTGAFFNCPALANIYVTTLSETSWHLLHTNTGATGTDYTIYNPDGTVAGSGTVAGTSQVLTLYGKSDELVISDNITPTLAEETAISQVQWHKSGLPYDDELMIFNAKNPDTVISNFITVNRAGEEFLGNSATATTAQTATTASTADKWKTARNVTISDADGTNTGTAVSVDGSENETLKLPSTIKATLTGNASTATAPFYQWKKLNTDLYRYVAGESPALTYYWYRLCKITTAMTFDIEVVSDTNHPFRASYRLSVSPYTSGTYISYTVALLNLGQTDTAQAKLAVAIDADGYLYIQTNAIWECSLHVTLLYSSSSSFSITMDKLGYAPFGTESGFTPVNLITQTGAFRWTDTGGITHSSTPIINTDIVGNASTADKWKTARNVTISDADGTNTGTAVSVDGSENETLKLPSTIKANLTGNASTATTASNGFINIRQTADFTLGTYLDGTHVSVANTHATNTITCTLPTGQTMNGQASFTIAPDTILGFELIGTAWKCVSNEWEHIVTYTGAGAKSNSIGQYRTLRLELYNSEGYMILSSISAIVNTIIMSFLLWATSGNHYIGGVGITCNTSTKTITSFNLYYWQRYSFGSLKIYGMK